MQEQSEGLQADRNSGQGAFDGATSARDENFVVRAPSISLPKGGGAVRGIGEKFTANPVTGTASLSVPIYMSPGRAGFGPQLSLSYDSGAGNGPFGFGWNLSLPSITRKTDKGLPKYRDAVESDVFILSGVEDLVPLLNRDGSRHEDATTSPGYKIHRYRPRIEGAFARIERWTRMSDGESWWRSISRDNVTTWYGKTENSRIADPAEPVYCVSSWLICESYDDKGNAIVYEYASEDSANVDLSRVHERNRTDATRSANRYLKRVKYGNTRSRHVQPDLAHMPWLFEAVLDYDEGHYEALPRDPGAHQVVRAAKDGGTDWEVRQDPFSRSRSGFEVRTYRLCRRVLMFHHFPSELGVDDCLVRSTEFAYDEGPVASYVTSVEQSGYARQDDGTYLKSSLPPLDFQYSKPDMSDTIEEVDPESLENLPIGIDGSTYQWVDLDGEGLSGILAEQSGGWHYKRNLGPLPAEDGDGQWKTRARFAPIETVGNIPSLARPGGRHRFVDLAGNGRLDVALLERPVSGYYERTHEQNWEPFRKFLSCPNVDWADADLRFVDLTGDGRADILITEHEAFTWYPSLAEDGFGPAKKASQALEEEAGPKLVFADGTQSIYLADFSGDGLTDLARIRNGEVCYWPNLGYGRFGPKVTMDNSPRFDRPDQFNQQRIRLADIDGSGTVDILYLGRDQIDIYRNESGNRWADAEALTNFPQIDNLSSVMAVDLLGNGTACLVWSSPLFGDAGRQMRYIDLMGGQKPHLMIGTDNNLGATTRITYAPSTKFYLQDKREGKPWITKIPFPVHVVEKTTVTDRWRRTNLSTTYSYHHGYFDGREREFRGFGRVDQIDVESFGTFAAGNAESPFITDDRTLYQPPVKTVTWFHTGAFLDRERIHSYYENEYFPNWFERLVPDETDVLGGFRENALPEPDIRPGELNPGERREAMRACKGMTLRQEIYELDVDALERGEERPVKLFSTAYHNCSIRKLQPQADNPHAVFHVSESEAITYHYELDLRSERLTPDPRVAHTLNLQMDELGNVLQSVAAVYPRIGRHGDETLPGGAEDLIAQVQRETHLSYTETRYTNDIDDPASPDRYRLRAPCEVLTYELTGIEPLDRYFSLEELRRLRLSKVHQTEGTPVAGIAYHQVSDRRDRQKRIVEHLRMLYFNENLRDPLPLGRLDALGLTYETYKLALTDNLLGAVLGDKLTVGIRNDLGDETLSGYLSGAGLDLRFPGIDNAGQYWMRSGVAGFASDAAEHFYLPERYVDPFGNETIISYDGGYDLFVRSSTDPVGNTMTVRQFDYRVLAPRETEDINGNLSEIAFDALGLPTAVAVKGKGSEGDSLTLAADLIDPDPSVRRAFFTTALDTTEPRRLLGGATARTIYYFGEVREADGTIRYAVHPPCAAAIRREQHVAALEPGAESPLQLAFEYSDGGGNVLVKKIQAEPEIPGGSLRWIASGKTVLNNKGKPVKQYEPYFTDSHTFEDPAEVGVTPIMYYDAAGRLFRTELPDGGFSRAEFSPWQAASYDSNDTVLEPGNGWYARHSDPAASPEDQRAARLAVEHADTPATVFLDSLGREVVSVAHNRVRDGTGALVDEKYVTFTRLDAEGKPLWIRDARGNLVMQYITPLKPARAADEPDPGNPEAVPAGTVPCYDIAGNLLFQHSMDAGDGWTINDAAGQPFHAWDANDRVTADGAMVHEDRVLHVTHDALRRPLEQRLRINGGPWLTVGRSVYGEGLPDDRARNLRGQVHRQYESSGLAENARFDFKGNLLEARRGLASEYEAPVIDWSDGSPTAGLDGETFTQATEYDALDRMTRLYNWHRDPGHVAVYEPRYNARGLLEGEDLFVGVGRAGTGHTGDVPTEVVGGIAYDAKGQRQRIGFGNGTVTRYDYDPLTFRLKQLRTTGPGADPDFPDHRSGLRDASVLQQLHYTYDPTGNITEIYDDAYEPVFFDNQHVEPRSRYTYDALYRLTEATGRENAAADTAPGQAEAAAAGVNFPLADGALRNYTQSYSYDSAGNILRMRHGAAGADRWTRHYDYAADSNRLLRSWTGTSDIDAVRYAYDIHGSMLNLANVAAEHRIRWDYRDMIHSLDLEGGGRAWYAYDAEKQRTRKRIERRDGTVEERLYLGGMELYRRWRDGAVVEEIETHHLFADDQRVLIVEDVLATDDASLGTGTLYKYQYGNHLGSVALELDAGARIISYEEYHPYGTPAYRARGRGVRATAKRYRYTGMERDEESGLNYHTARYYAPWLGRWCSADPIGLEGGLDFYSAMGNNPVGMSDRDGLQPFPTGSLIGDHPQLSRQWEIATQNVLERRYHGGTLSENMRRYDSEITRLIQENNGDLGSNRRAGTAIHRARRTYSRIRRAFGQRVRLPSGTQVHHAFDHVARNPHQALNASQLEISRGHATRPGSEHYAAHLGDELRQAGVRNPRRVARRMSRMRAHHRSRTAGFALPPVLAIIAAGSFAAMVITAQTGPETFELLGYAALEYAAARALGPRVAGPLGFVFLEGDSGPPSQEQLDQMFEAGWAVHRGHVIESLSETFGELERSLENYSRFLENFGRNGDSWRQDYIENINSRFNSELTGIIADISADLGQLSRSDLRTVRESLIEHGASETLVHHLIR